MILHGAMQLFAGLITGGLVGCIACWLQGKIEG